MTTLKLHPEKRTTIAFSTAGINAPSGYFFQPGALDLSESQRLELVYSDKKYISTKVKLIPATFDVIVWADTRNNLLDYAKTLEMAVSNDLGGWLEYKPSDSSSVSTYYRYEKSEVPTVNKSRINHWDNYQEISQQKYIITLSITLQTHPIGVSDPNNLISITPTDLSGSYPENRYRIDSLDIKGDQPAAIIPNIQNTNAWSIHKLLAATRSTYYSVLNNFQVIYLAENATTSGSWSDSGATPESYGATTIKTNTPAALDTVETITFPISNITEHAGYFSVYANLNTGGLNAGDWKIKSALNLGNTTYIQNSDYFSPVYESKWHWVYCGDINFEEQNIDESLLSNGSITLTITKISGNLSESINIDCIYLVLQDESAIEVQSYSSAASGIATNEKIKLDYLPKLDKRSHLLLDNSDAFVGLASYSYGSDILTAAPKQDTDFVFVGEGVSGLTAMVNSNEAYTINFKALYRTIYPFE